MALAAAAAGVLVVGGGLGWHCLVGGGCHVFLALIVVCYGGTGVGLAVFNNDGCGKDWGVVRCIY